MRQLWTLVIGDAVTVAQQPQGGVYIADGRIDGGVYIKDSEVENLIKALQKHKRGLKPKKPAATGKRETKVPAPRMRRVK